MDQISTPRYFTDHDILVDPYAHLEELRAAGPVSVMQDSDIVIVTGYDECLQVLNNTADFSSANAPQGPAVALPFVPSGDDLTAQIEAHRAGFYGGHHVVAYDGQRHVFSRSLLSRLFTPSRLKANLQFVTGLADSMVGDVVAKGRCELIGDVATPFVTLVIADLLGVPAQDRQLFMDAIDAGPPPGSLDPEDLKKRGEPLRIMASYFENYITKRRVAPQDDILSELCHATYPDGSAPDPAEIVRLSTFMFGAGQDTSAKLIGNAMRFLVARPELQTQVREDPTLVPDLIEEVLRLEGSSKMTARLARRRTRIGDMDIAPGTRIFVALAAANRDPDRWEDPAALILGRRRIKEHVGFGRGAHVCACAPLARAEVRVILERFLALTSDIRFDPEVHGPAERREFDYEPSFLIRGLTRLELMLSPR